MSWSLGPVIGKKTKLKEYLAKVAAGMTGQSKVEFDDARTIIESSLDQNFRPASEEEVILRVEGSGHGQATGTEQVRRQMSLKIEPFNGTLLV